VACADQYTTIFCGEWKYMARADNVFWLGIIKGAFRITFYFTDRAAKAIADSAIPVEMKKQFKDGKHYGKIRGLTVVFKYKKDIETAKAETCVWRAYDKSYDDRDHEWVESIGNVRDERSSPVGMF